MAAEKTVQMLEVLQHKKHYQYSIPVFSQVSTTIYPKEIKDKAL